MEPNLADQIAVATGASKGIGLDFVAADLSTWPGHAPWLRQPPSAVALAYWSTTLAPSSRASAGS
jgi:hypothetical protein